MLSKRILTLVFVVAFLTLLVGCFPSPVPPITENQAPIITSDPVTTAKVGVDYTYHVKATDPDEDDLEYSLTVSPKSMTINPTTGIINWDPQIKDVGDHDVIVKVSDGDLDITQSFIILVSGAAEAEVPTPEPEPTPEPGPSPAPTPTPTPVETYTITATADPGGSINPLGAITVNKGSDKTFTIALAANYHIADVLVDGGSAGAVNSYTFTNVTADHTIHATFEAVELTHIVVNPTEMTLGIGDTWGFTVAAHYNYGPTTSIAPDCTYLSSNGNIATVIISPSPEHRKVEAIGLGTATITVSYMGKECTIEVTVGPVHNVTQDFYRNTIKAAIDDGLTLAGDVIEVSPGTYKESLEIKKCLTLVSTEGPENTKIDVPSGTGILIRADGVTVEGFKVSGDKLHYGILVRKGVGVNILNNIVTGTTSHGAIELYGDLGDLVEITVSGNTIDNCDYPIAVQGNKFSISNCTISDNTITNSTGPDWGVIPFSGEVSDITISGNEISGNEDMNGILFGKGIFKNIVVENNTVSGNKNGVLIKADADFTNLVINFNNIEGNTTGVLNESALLVYAEANWWGIGGTGDDAGKPGEEGNNDVSANVDYIPWSTVPY